MEDIDRETDKENLIEVRIWNAIVLGHLRYVKHTERLHWYPK